LLMPREATNQWVSWLSGWQGPSSRRLAHGFNPQSGRPWFKGLTFCILQLGHRNAKRVVESPSNFPVLSFDFLRGDREFSIRSPWHLEFSG
jgi:hypothetical protein